MKKNKWTRNMGLKIISVLFAISLWLVVVNMNDPVTSHRYTNIPVNFLNTATLTNAGEVYEVLDGTDVINSVTITAQRSILDLIDSSDIVATADFAEDLQEDGTVNIELSLNRYNSKISSIKGSIDKVKLNIETKKTLQLVLKATTSGTVAEGCMVGNITTDQNLVRIEGPESVVSSISKASVNVDVSGANSTVATYANVVLYDADGNEVTHPALTKNCDKVRVTVEILNTKEVPVNMTVMGTPASGYLASGEIATDPETVRIAGTATNLAKIDSITVPETELNVTGQSEDMTVYVDLTSYLPSGITWADPAFNGTVMVTISIEKAEQRTLTIPKTSAVVVNVPDGFTAELQIGHNDSEDYEVQVIGLPENVDRVRESDVVGYIDMNSFMADQELSGPEELQPGTYQVELLFNNLNGTELVHPVNAQLIITADDEEEQ